LARNGAKERLWTRELILSALANLFLGLVFYLLMTTMALYAVARFGASDTLGGLTSSMFVIGATAARLFAGNLVDLIGRRRALLIFMAVFLAASVSYLPIDSFQSIGALLAIRAIHGVAFAIASTAASALAQARIPASRRGEGTGYYALSLTLAPALGPFLALLLVQRTGYPALFIAASVMSLLGMLVSLFVRSADAPLSPAERARLRRFHPRDMLHVNVIPVATFMFVTSLAYSGVLTFLEAYADGHGLTTGASLFFLVYAAVLFVSRFVAGRIQDVRGDNLIVYTALVAFTAGLVVLAVARADAVLLVSGGLIGMGFGTLVSALQAVAVNRVPVQRIGVAISTHFFMIDLGIGVGPVFLGLLLAHTGYSGMYLLLAGVVVFSAGLYHLVHGRIDRAHRRSVVMMGASHQSDEPVINRQ
jgi:MFS family permease